MKTDTGSPYQQPVAADVVAAGLLSPLHTSPATPIQTPYLFVRRPSFMVSYRGFGRRNDLMRRSNYIILLGVAAAAGSALGMLSDRRHPAKGGLLGATAGVVAGSVAAGVYHYITSGNNVPYYSHDSALYEDLDTI